MKNRHVFAPFLLAVCLPLSGCDDCAVPPGPGDHDVPADRVVELPEPPADWTLPAVDAEGFAALREQAAAEGQVLVVDTWATWCTSCLAMFPKLHAAMAERGDNVRLVSLCFDEGEDSVAQAERFLIDRHAWQDAVIADPDAKDAIAESVGGAWDGGVLPAVFVFGKDGKLAYEMTETRGEVDDWVAAIAAAVDGAVETQPGAKPGR